MAYRSPDITVEVTERLQILKRASWAGIIGNILLAGLKIAAGLLSGSLAVVGDGIDSLSDVVTSMVTLYAAQAGAAPPDKEHPWGHGRVETIATKTLSLVIIMAGVQLLILAILKLTGDKVSELPGLFALLASGISIVGKILLMVYKRAAGRKANSKMMLADAVNMRNDIFLSLTVLFGVFFTRILDLPIIDLVAGFLVSLWIIRSGISVFLSASIELMDSVEDTGIYREVFTAVDEVEGVSNPHRVRIRGLNSLYVIDLDVEVDGALTVNEAHAMACEVEDHIRRRIQKVYDIMVHVEPAGAGEHKEAYGLVPGDLEK